MRDETFQEDPPREKPDGDEGEGPGEGHNSEQIMRDARLVAENKAQHAYAELQAKEDKLMLLHIKPIRDEKAKVKREYCDTYGTPVKIFNARNSLLQIELEGDELEIAAMRESFEATPVGQNVDLVNVLQKAEEKRKERINAASGKANRAAARAKKQAESSDTPVVQL
jgi:hypothetical protein